MRLLQASLRQLRHLVVLGEEAHFGRAARRLSLSQPALSRSIKAFEDAYRVSLVERDATDQFLTRTGEEAVRLARVILLNAAHLDETLRAEASGGSGNVFAGVAPLPAAIALSHICTRILKDRPAVRFYADVQSAAQLAEHLLRATYDFVLCSRNSMEGPDRFHWTPVGRIPFDLVVRRGHPLAGRTRLSAQDIKGFPIIGAHVGAMGRQADFDAGTSFSEFGPLTLSSDNYDALGRVTQASDAVWLTSRLAASREIRTGALVALVKTGLKLPASIELCLTTLKGASQSPTILAVMADIRKIMADLTA
jgi:DNA-binding transcriptional LysR family regulator